MVGIQPIVVARYENLVLPPTTQLHAFPDGYLKHSPSFNAEKRPFVEDPLDAFLDFADNINIEHEDIYTRLFVQSLERNVKLWFRQLQAYSINSWAELVNIFKNQWEIRKDDVYYLTEFEDFKRNPGKPVVDFIKRFNKIYNKMPPY